MQKFLIIVKFASIDHFCQFHGQLSSGRVFLPSTTPLPLNSNTLLQLWIPEVKTSFLFPGKIIPSTGPNRKKSGMTADVSIELSRLMPRLNQTLAAMDTYRHRLSLILTEYDESVTNSEDIPEPRIETSENESQPNGFQSDEFRPEDQTYIESDLSVDSGLEPLTDDELLHLEMENAEDRLSNTFDLEIQPKALAKDDGLEFQLQTDDDEIQFSEPEPQISELPAFRTPSNQNQPGILFDDIKQMVNQVEFEREIAPPAPFSSKRIPEKKELTPEERTQAEPVGKFFMNLTKAMLRSGYYDPDHPSSKFAKKGLYDEFISVLGECQEIMITQQSTREGTDMMLTGILEEPVSIRQLVGPGVAELFVPKLTAYCEKKKLLSFAIKKEIAPGHFYDFIDIMSDPKVDKEGEESAGKYLTSALVAHGIIEISTIFVDDMLELEAKLPWRVEMAIQRLAKDLKVLPMFQGVSSESVRKMKLQTVKDIIRPLKHPIYLNDFLVNSYMIAKYVDSMAPEDIEAMIVDAFSLDLLLPTTQFTFKELDSLNHLKFEQPDNEQIPRRLTGIRRILKLIATRVVAGNIPGVHHFLQQLHQNSILNFEELPVEVQYFINSVKMADDVQNNFSKYMNAFDHQKNPAAALIYLQCFRRVVAVFAESDRWDAVSRIAATLKSACPRQPLNSDQVHSGLKVVRKDGIEDFSTSHLCLSLKPADRPIGFVFKDISDHIIQKYAESDKNQRRILDHIIDDLGSFGANILSRMITDSPDREVRKQSFEALITKGVHARDWATAALDDPHHPWFVHRNAMMILGKVSHEEGDFACARKFLDHENPKIREEVLNLILSLRPGDAESLIIRALNDSDPKVRWRAIKNLEQFNPISKSAMSMLLAIISAPLPNDKDLAAQQITKNIAIISAINAMPSIPKSGEIESIILDAVKSIAGEKKSFWKKVATAVGSDHESVVLKAAVPLLGKIGGNASIIFLKQAAKSHPNLSEIIKKAMLQIK